MKGDLGQNILFSLFFSPTTALCDSDSNVLSNRGIIPRKYFTTMQTKYVQNIGSLHFNLQLLAQPEPVLHIFQF